MAAAKGNARAVALSALLHLAIIGFLLLATLSCGTWESSFAWLGVPPWMNPVQCTRPAPLAGPVIEAELVGVAASPAPAPLHLRQPKIKPLPAPPPPPPAQIPNPKGPRLPVHTLPPPPQRPDLREQQRVVDLAEQKAEQAKQAEVERQQQRMSEVDAARQDKVQKLLAEMNNLRQQREALDKRARLAAQKDAQLKDLKTPPVAAAPNLPSAPKPVSGMGGVQQSLQAQYQAALVQAIQQNWLRPDNIQKHVICPIRIMQIPGGKVISATILPGCPYDEVARRSVEAAVLRASPLPYQGFESVFSSELTINFSVNQ
jgi:colicin import membrane protein